MWGVRAYVRARQVPPESALEDIGRVALTFRSELAQPVAELVLALRGHTDPEAASVAARLESLARVMGAPPDPDTTTRNPVLS